VGPRGGLDTEAKGKILLPLPGIEHRSPGRPVRFHGAREENKPRTTSADIMYNALLFVYL
jgi:hypothetical protein